jgi:hypothetical protein
MKFFKRQKRRKFKQVLPSDLEFFKRDHRTSAQVEAKMHRLILKIAGNQKKVENNIKSKNPLKFSEDIKYKGILIVIIAFLSTFLVLINKNANTDLSVAEDRILQKAIFVISK